MLFNKIEQLEAECLLDWQQLQRLCLQRGWDIGQLARQAGVSRTTLYHWQSQKTVKPRLSTLHKLAEALQVDPVQLTNQADFGPAQDAAAQAPAHDLHDWKMDLQAALFDRQTNWCIQEVCEKSPELFVGWTEQEWTELFSSFGTGGELNEQGVLQQATTINQRRETLYELHVLLETHLADAARRVIHSLYESVQCPESHPASGSISPSLHSAVPQKNGS